MPSPKDGKAGSAVPPAEPKEAMAADLADPGLMAKLKSEQRQIQSGKYGSIQIQSHQPPQTREEKAEKPSWIEIELVDKKGKPVAGEAYSVKLPDGTTVADGTLDDKGFARVEGIEPGTCKITFPRLEKQAWKPK
jgi:hypothetical protein